MCLFSYVVHVSISILGHFKVDNYKLRHSDFAPIVSKCDMHLSGGLGSSDVPHRDIGPLVYVDLPVVGPTGQPPPCQADEHQRSRVPLRLARSLSPHACSRPECGASSVLPSGIIEAIDKRQRAFLWTGEGNLLWWRYVR
jgi:hypothetical protein